MPVCIIEIRGFFYEACFYRKKIVFSKAQKLFRRQTLLQNNNDARSISSPTTPRPDLGPTRPPIQRIPVIFLREQSGRDVKLPTLHHPVPMLRMTAFTTSPRRNNFTLFLYHNPENFPFEYFSFVLVTRLTEMNPLMFLLRLFFKKYLNLNKNVS